jgi:DNA-binding response OmpR family regulator
MIVELLSNYPTQIFDREMIYEKLWGFDKEGDNRMVTEFISRKRR